MTNIDPAKVLDLAGIDDYQIDRDINTVWVNDIKPIAGFFDRKLYVGVTGFRAYGWEYMVRDTHQTPQNDPES